MNAPALVLPDLPGMESFLEATGMVGKLDDDGLEKYYALAYQLTQLGQHQQAGRLFGLLCLYRPRELRLWQGAALCARKLKDYPTAVRAYMRCLALAPDDNGFAFDVVDCLCLANERPAALAVLGEMVRTAKAIGDEDYRVRAQRVLDRLQGDGHEQPA